MIRDVELKPHVARLQFQEEAHLYSVGGEGILPSITEILKAEGITSYQEGNDWAMTRGQYIHRAVELFEEGTLDEESLSGGLRNYLDSYRLWREAVNFVPQVVEVPLWHPLHKYGGTPDLIGLLNGKPHIVELKSGARRAGDRIQVGGQAELARACIVGADREWYTGTVLYLRANGNPPGIEPISAEAMLYEMSMFKNVLAVNRWKAVNG